MAFKKERKIKVYETMVSRQEASGWYKGTTYKSIPQIRMQGVWLEQLGFEPGMELKIVCEKGKMEIHTVDEKSIQ